MARIYSRKKGRHSSKHPPIKIIPRWLRLKKKEVEDLVIKLAKEKHNSAVIGTILRDQYGIPDVKTVVGKNTVEIMEENKIYPEFPEDLMSLFKKVVSLREHVMKNKADKGSLKGLEHMEAKIRRLMKYYKREGKVPKDFEFNPEKIKLIVQK